MSIIVRAVFIGMLITFAGSIPRSLLFLANLRILPQFPWAVPVTALYLWLFWRYLNGAGSSWRPAQERKQSLRANPLSVRLWSWVADRRCSGPRCAGARSASRQPLRCSSGADVSRSRKRSPTAMIEGLLLIAAPAAGIIEESAFRGYMQGPIERRLGLLAFI